MNYKITKRQLQKITEHIESSDSLNEGGFWSGLRKVFTGSNFSDYANDLEDLLVEIQQNIYEDRDVIAKVRELYLDIQKSDLDRRDKKELLSIMYNLYNILENGNRAIDKEIRRLQYLGR